MSRFLIAFIVVSSHWHNACFAQSALSYSLLPDSLKLHASVIKLEESVNFEVSDIDRATLTVHKVFTVTSSEGKDALLFSEYSNKYIEIDYAEVLIHDAAGKITDKYKKKDMTTVAVGEGLVEEGFVTYYRVSAPAYPITVEFNYAIKFRGTLFYPEYEIQNSSEAVASSVFIAKVPASLGLRFKEQNIKLAPDIKDDGKYKIYTWAVKNLPALPYEEGSVSYRSRYPRIILAPNQFRIYDEEGDMSSWKNFGNWEYQLTQGLEQLPPERKSFFENMVKDAGSTREKAKIIYNYLQKNFRYVSIQLGIGGYKPFPAVFTDQKKYGDCKGLSFYMYSILSALGIKSHIALINGGAKEQSVADDFPCNQFNHMILCIPQEKDSIWLECTSKTNDFGVLGSFTENRKALLITEKGGILAATPPSKASDNIFASKSIIALTENGSGNAAVSILVKGEYKQDFIHDLFEEKSDDQKNYLVNDLGFKQPDVFDIQKKEKAGELYAEINFEYEKIHDFSAGSKLFLAPSIRKLIQFELPRTANRRLDFYFAHPFTKSDTTIFKLPEGFIKDLLPEDKNLTCAHASFSSKYWFNEKENAVYTTARLILNDQRIPAADFAEVKAFFDEVKKVLNTHIVIKKQ